MRRTWGALLAAGVLTLLPTAMTHALFTASGQVDSNMFSTGTIDLSSSPSTALVSLSRMAPGDVVTAPITLANAGSLRLRYRMSTAVSEDSVLADALALTIKSGVGRCSTSGFALSGTELYDGSLGRGSIGDVTWGAGPGTRTLEPSASEELCFRVQLPASAGNEVDGLATTATFTFHAEQTPGV